MVFDPTLPGYEIGKTLLQQAASLYSKYTTAKARSLMDHARGAYWNPYLADFLERKYPGHPLLTVNSHRYPIVTFPTQSDVESVLKRPVTLTRQGDSSLLPGSARYRALATRLGLESYDRPCFTMTHLHTEPEVTLECEFGSYFRALDTCDELAWELEVQHERLTGNSAGCLGAFDNLLSRPNKLHAVVDDPVRDGSRRSAAIAVSALIAFRDGDDLFFLARRRGTKSVAVQVGMVHVVPSFMFQPATNHYPEEFSIRHNLFREYLEELFNRPEPEEHEGDSRYFYGDSRLRYLRKLLEDRSATLKLTGVAVNLLNLRPEVCLLLTIDDPEWFSYHREHPESDQRFHFNDEWLRVVHMGDNAESAVARIQYCVDDEELLARAGIKAPDIVPPGAACLWLGKRVLDSTMRQSS